MTDDEEKALVDLEEKTPPEKDPQNYPAGTDIIEEKFPQPEVTPDEAELGTWRPRLNLTQQRIFDSSASFLLMYGEKLSGKSHGGLHGLVRHCYENNDALALIIAPQIRSGKEGVVADLEKNVLDDWKYGNKNPLTGERYDSGIGLDFTPAAYDPLTKDRIIYIGNRHGGWSKVILISIPYKEVVEKRMRSMSPSFVYVDEVTMLDGSEYFTYVVAQLFRRRGIDGPQQYVASCNPEGPSHWVYQVFFIDSIIDTDTGKRHPEYEIYHVPVTENLHNLPPKALSNLQLALKDPIKRRQLLKGEWVDRPSGDAIFRVYFKVEIHVRPAPNTPEYKKGQGLLPWKGYPLMVGHDPGPKNYCVSFEQMIPTKEKNIWITFDELNYVGKYMPYSVVVKDILKKMDKWYTFLGGATFLHIADEEAFNQRRHDGSFDNLTIEKLANGKIKMRPCPKGKESVPARVQMTIGLLLEESWFISARCPKTHEAMLYLQAQKGKDGAYDPYVGLRPLRSPHIHPYDAATYPQFYFTVHPSRFVLQTGEATSTVFAAGRG